MDFKNNILNGTNLNEQFCDDIKEGTVVVSCGAKRSGKSTFMLSMLRASVDAKAYDDYILIFPSLYVEQHDSYLWCMKKKEFTIYTGYHPSIVQKLYHRNREPKTRKKTLLIIDDATTFAKELKYAIDPDILGLISQSRHIQVTTWLLLHSLKGIISPCLRENTGYLIIYSITNVKLLADIWEEYVSCFTKFEEFKDYYMKLAQKKYSSFLLKTLPPVAIDNDSNNWNMITHFRLLNTNNVPNKKTKDNASVKNV